MTQRTAPKPKTTSTFRCCADATSVRGLAALRRAFPDEWMAKLTDPCAYVNREHRPASLAQWLVWGALGDLLPRNDRDESFQARRASARRWLAFCDVPIEDIDERQLRAIVERRLARDGAMTATFRRDCTCLRRWVRQAQVYTARIKPRVGPRWRGLPPATATRSRETPEIEDAIQLLRAAPLDVRVMIGLALGGRLTTGEIANASFDRVGPDYATLEVTRGSRRGHPRDRIVDRIVALPMWVRDLAREAWGAATPATGLCFPGRRGRRRNDLDGVLRRIGRKIGSEGITFEGLRRLGQAIARQHDASRVTVRGVVGASGGTGRRPPEPDVFAREQQLLAEGWHDLQNPPVEPGRIPARAPKGCRPTEPELDTSRRLVRSRFGAMLPKTCEPQERSTSPSLAATVASPMTGRA